jgi:predicted dehydrogenase
MRVGFVGQGLIGARRRSITESLGIETAFVVDPSPVLIEKLANSPFPVVSSIEEVEVSNRSDAVFVAVPHDLAMQATQWAFARGAHVLCEKPMGISSAQAHQIAATAESTGLIFSAGFNYRYLAGIRRLRSLIDEGALGEIFAARILMGHGGRPGMELEWKLSAQHAGGGALIDPGIHLIDLAGYLFGSPQVLSARVRKSFWHADVEDRCALALNCAGTDVSIDVNLVSWKNLFSIEVFGRDATVLISGRGGNYGTQTLEFVNRWFWDGDDRRQSVDLGVDDQSFTLETTEFIEAARGFSSSTALSISSDGVRAIQVVESAYEIAKWDRFRGTPKEA